MAANVVEKWAICARSMDRKTLFRICRFELTNFCVNEFFYPTGEKTQNFRRENLHNFCRNFENPQKTFTEQLFSTPLGEKGETLIFQITTLNAMKKK